MRSLKWILSFLFITLITLISCRKDLEKISWNTDMVVPIAHTSLNLKNLLQDTSLTEDKNNLLQVVYTEEIDRFSPFDTLVELSIDSFATQVTLSSIELSDITISEDNSVGDIITSAGLDGQSFGLFTISDGATFPSFFLGLIPPFSTPPNDIDVSDFFESAILSEGYIDLVIENNTDFDISSMYISVVDKVTSDTLLTEKISAYYDQNNNYVGEPIYANSTYEKIGIDLADILGGKEIHGQLIFRIENIGFSPPKDADYVTLDYSDNFTFSITLRDLKVEKATAIFPAQNVLERIEEVPIGTQDNIELKYGIVRKGQVSINVKSTIPVPLYFDYAMPSAEKNGVSFTIPTQKVPAGTIDNPSVYSRSFLLDGYSVDFSGLPDRLVGDPKYAGFNSNLTNTIIQELYGRIEDVNTPVSLSLNDTLTLEVKVENLEVDYIEGYLGQQTSSIGPQALDFSYSQNLPFEALSFERIDVGISFENEIGVPAQLKINQLDFLNQGSGNSASVANLPATIDIASAEKEGNATAKGNGDFFISNSKEIYDLKPDFINYQFDLLVNPNGNTPLYSNFASTNSELVLFSTIKFPLSVVANDFILEDTVSVNKGEGAIQENIEDGVVNLITDNGFPFLMDVKLYFKDSTSGQVLDSLIAEGQIPAAPVNDQGRVTDKVRSVIPFPFDKERLNTLLSPEMNQIVFKVIINSADKTKYYSIYSDYSLDVKLSGDFNLKVNSKL